MQAIQRLLWVKILGTLVFAALPLILVPEPLYLWLGFPEQPSMVFLRLYGFSTLALLVGYYGGIEACRSGHYPRVVLYMGLVSNGSQGLVLWVAGLAGVYQSWGGLAKLMMWGLAVFIGGVALAIAYTILTRGRR